MRKAEFRALAGWVPLTALFLSTTADAGEPLPVLAVFPIQDSAGRLDEKALSQLTDYLTVLVAASGRFTIVPRTDLETALREKKADSYKQCVDQDCQIETGREVAAQKVCQTQIVKLGDQCAVTTTIYDLRAGASEKAAVAKGGCSENELVETLEKTVRDLLGHSPAPAPVATAPAAPTRPAPKPPPAPKPTPPPPAPSTSSPAPVATAPPAPKPPPPVKPTKSTYALSVETEPDDAEVTINGRVMGRGSVSAELKPAETHRLGVRREGYTTHAEEISIGKDSSRRVVLSMTAETRKRRSEVFSFSPAFYASLGTSLGGGLWLQAPALRFGNIVWTVAEAFAGLHQAYAMDPLQDGGADVKDPVTCLYGEDQVGVLFMLSTRVGYRLALDDAGAYTLEFSLGPALHVNYGIDRTLSDEFAGLSLQPAIRFLRVPEGSFGVGLGLRASIPLHHGCPYTVANGALSYARCALGNPVLFQVEIPFGVY